MKNVSLTMLKKYQTAIVKTKQKHLSVESLSRVIGIYADIIADDLSLLDPMIRMNPNYDVKTLLPLLDEHIKEMEQHKKVNRPPRETIKRKELEEYGSLIDFVYQKMCVGGLLDRGGQLSDRDLKLMKKLINEELNRRKPKKGK